MKKKNTITYLIIFFLMVFSLVIGIFPLFLVILITFILYKLITGNKNLKKKKEIIKDYLTHEYGEKMGNYILEKAMEKKK